HAGDVDVRRELDVHALLPRLPSERGAEALLQTGIPARRLRDRRRERRRPLLLVADALTRVVQDEIGDAEARVARDVARDAVVLPDVVGLVDERDLVVE